MTPVPFKSIGYEFFLGIIAVFTLLVIGIVLNTISYRKAETEEERRKAKSRLKIYSILLAVLVLVTLYALRNRYFGIGGSILTFALLSWLFPYYAVLIFDAVLIGVWIIKLVLYAAEKRPELKQIKKRKLIGSAIFSVILVVIVNIAGFLFSIEVPFYIVLCDAIVACVCKWLVQLSLKLTRNKRRYIRLTVVAALIVAAVLFTVVLIL